MAFRFYIDSQLTDQPINDTALITTIKRDSTLGALLITQDVELSYNANNDLKPGEISGFAYLKSLFDIGICQEAVIEIYDPWSATESPLVYKGVIKVSSIKLDEQQQNLSMKIQDNSFYSYISNNKNVVYQLLSNKTKSKLDVSPPPVYDVDMFNSINGLYGSTIGYLFKGFRVYDVFKFLTLALSDNKVSFESFYLRSTAELFIFDGAALVNENSSPNVNISFASLYDEILKARNVTFFIDQTNPEAPILRLEDKASLFSGTQILSFDDIKGLISSVKQDRLYGTVKVGAEYNPGGADTTIYTFLAGTSYFGWKEEVYTPIGQCNTDIELDLVNKFLISSNAINDQLGGVVDSYLDSLFLVECENVDDVGFTADAIRYSYFGSAPPYYYNLGINNVAKMQVHGSDVQSTINNTQDVGGDGFQASLGTELLVATYNPSSPVFLGGAGSVIVPFIFPDELSGNNYDGNGNYNNVSGVYTVPVPGVYSFNTNVKLSIENIRHCFNVQFDVSSAPAGYPINLGVQFADLYRGYRITLSLIAFDSTLTNLLAQTNKVLNTYQDGDFVMDLNLAADLPVGAVVFARLASVGSPYAPQLVPFPLLDQALYGFVIFTGNQCPNVFPFSNVIASADSLYTCNGTPTGGVVLSGNDPNLYNAYLHEFEYEISAEDFQSIKANPTGRFNFTKDGITRTGWIDTMTRNDWTGITQIKLVTNNATISE